MDVEVVSGCGCEWCVEVGEDPYLAFCVELGLDEGHIWAVDVLLASFDEDRHAIAAVDKAWPCIVLVEIPLENVLDIGPITQRWHACQNLCAREAWSLRLDLSPLTLVGRCKRGALVVWVEWSDKRLEWLIEHAIRLLVVAVVLLVFSDCFLGLALVERVFQWAVKLLSGAEWSIFPCVVCFFFSIVVLIWSLEWCMVFIFIEGDTVSW